MSDSDFQMSADEEDYDFEYENDDDDEMENEDGDMDMDAENKYYNAKAEREDTPDLAIEWFQSMMESEPADSEWGFKASKQLIKLLFNLGRKSETLKVFPQLFARINTMNSSSTNKRYIEKSVQSILDYLTCDDLSFMERILDIAISGLADAGNDRLLVRINLRLVNIYLSHKSSKADENQIKAESILQKLAPLVEMSSDGSASDKNTYILEYLACQLQLAAAIGDARKLRQYYQKAFKVQSVAIPHPRTLGLIREYGGQLHMREKKWSEAREDFFESFKNYDEAGSHSRIRVLKYYVLACMLSESGINPFDSQETKPYKNDSQIVGVVRLIEAFQRSDMEEFQKTISENDSVIRDPFIKDFLGDLINSLRLMSILTSVKPYSRIGFAKLASLVGGVSSDEVRQLVMTLILDGRLPKAKIDASKDVLIVSSSKADKHEEPSRIKKLPVRYTQNETGQKQELEQQKLITDSSTAISATSANQPSTNLDRERNKFLQQWVSAATALRRECLTR